MNNKFNALAVALLSVISSSAFANAELYKTDADLLELTGRAYAWLLCTTHGVPSGAVTHSSFPLVQGEGRDGVLLCALTGKTE